MSNAPKKLPAAFEKALLGYLKRTYLKKGRADSPWNQRDTEYFARGIVELNRSFTETRSQKAFNYLNDPIMRSGYLAYFLPVNAMKAYGILNRFHTPDLKKERIRVADIGAGPLTLSFGLLFHLTNELEKFPDAKITLQIDAFEQNKKIVTDGRGILFDYLRESGLEKRISVQIRDFSGSFFTHLRGAGTYDYLLLGNILNEFDERSDQVSLVLRILSQLSKSSTMALFIEPGSKKFTRDLQAVRDEILEATDYRIQAPCLHQSKCPLNLTAKSDWCNFNEAWQAPQFIRDFDELTELKKSFLLYSYLLLKNDVASAPKNSKKDFLAISDLMKEKGRLEVVGCGPAGRVRFIRAHRDMTKSNEDFERIRRGTKFSAPDFEPKPDFELNRNMPLKAKERIVV